MAMLSRFTDPDKKKEYVPAVILPKSSIMDQIQDIKDLREGDDEYYGEEYDEEVEDEEGEDEIEEESEDVDDEDEEIVAQDDEESDE